MRNKVFLSILTAFILCCLWGCSSRESDALPIDVAADFPAVDAGTGTLSTGKELLEPDAGDSPAVEDVEEISKVPGTIAVFICGAVENPGVYELPEDSRAGDAVEAAGGFLEDADQTFVNLAARLPDGVKLMIPTKEETSDVAVKADIDSFDASGEAVLDESIVKGAVNINTASAEQLKTIPGIGDAVAGKIVKYREENGAFKVKEDIMNVSGIKEKLFSKIKDQITV